MPLQQCPPPVPLESLLVSPLGASMRLWGLGGQWGE